MIDEKIIPAYEKVKRASASNFRDSYLRAHWEILFAYYNSSNERQLRIGCMPCYGKVLQFVAAQISQHDPRTPV